jgi:hypothetical protein
LRGFAGASDDDVVVPYAGLARHLAATLPALGAQRYPRSRFELIVVRGPAAEAPPGFLLVQARSYARA